MKPATYADLSREQLMALHTVLMGQIQHGVESGYLIEHIDGPDPRIDVYRDSGDRVEFWLYGPVLCYRDEVPVYHGNIFEFIRTCARFGLSY